MSLNLAKSIEESRLTDPAKICRALFLSVHGHAADWMMFYHDDKDMRQAASQFESMVGAKAFESAILTLRQPHWRSFEIYAPTADVPGWTVHISDAGNGNWSGFGQLLPAALGAALAKALAT